MSFTEQDLDNLSTLARITVSLEEKEKMLHDMQDILGYISEINAVPREALGDFSLRSGDVSGDLDKGVDPLRNVVREDCITCEAGSKTEAILENVPEAEGGYVKVMQVFK